MTEEAESVDPRASKRGTDARRDRRLERDGQAVVADFRDFFEEADTQRALAIGAMWELKSAVARLESDTGLSATSDRLTDTQRAEFEAARERAELARIQDEQQYAHLNELTLIGMFGNLDGYVEALLPATREMTARVLARSAIDQAEGERPELFAGEEPIGGDVVKAIEDALVLVLKDRLPNLKRPTGGGAERWERLLRPEGLGASADRPLPKSLDEALEEVGALRDVIVHRAGRIDAKALARCPRLGTQLHFEAGQFVRISRSQYRRYSAALRAYGEEVTRRVLRRGGIDLPVDLDRWEDFVFVGA